MKLKEVGLSRDISRIPLLVPDSVPDTALRTIGLPTRRVYLKGGWNHGPGGVWVSVSPDNSRIYPVPAPLSSTMEWEVAEPPVTEEAEDLKDV